MPGGESLQLDAYVRVSKVGGRAGDSFISPDDQRERIAAWAISRGVTIAEWHVDLDQTGGTLARPALDRLMQRVRAGQTGGVAVAYVDRLSRADVGDALRLVQEISDAGGQLAALDLGIDPTTPFGEFGMTILLALGRMQRRRIAEGWNVATERAVRRGVHSHAPFGYRKQGKGAPLERDPELAPVVVGAFERRAAGESWTALARWLDTQAPPRQGGQWTRRAAETVIQNRAYLGEARYGKHRNPDAHGAIVGPDLWEAAQLARAPRPARGEAGLLSGLVRCAGCRHRLQPATVGERKAKVYRCKRKHNAGDCPSPAYVNRAVIEQHVEALFLARYGAISLEGKVATGGLSDAQQRVADAESRLAEYRDNPAIQRSLAQLGESAFEAGIDARVAAVLEARDELERARRETVGIDIGPALAVWPDLTIAERRRLLTEGIDSVFLRRMINGRPSPIADRVLVLWRGEAPNDLPGPGLRVEVRSFDW